MAGNTANARVWLMGDVYVAPEGTPLPTNTASALNAAFKPLGLLSADDGLTQSTNETITDHHAWGGILVRTTRSKFKKSMGVTALEDNDVLFQLLNPGSTRATSGNITTRQYKVPQAQRNAFVVECKDGDITRRLVVPVGEAFPDGDVEANEEGIETRALMIHIYPDSSGNVHYEVTDDPQAISA